MGKLSYFKWMSDDAEVLKENMTAEQIGELFVAVMDYLQTGTVKEVSTDIRFAYADYRKKVDRACVSYDETCAKRAESGKKGGKAKAKNAAKAAGPTPDQAKKFKPPTLSQFKNAVKEVVDQNCFDDVNSYDIEAFFDSLNEQAWNLEGMAIQSRKDWESIIYARFHDALSNYHDGLYISYYEIFCYLISAYPQLHYRWEDVDEIISNLLDCWEDVHWDVNGSVFEQRSWKAALNNLATEWIKEIPP